MPIFCNGTHWANATLLQTLWDPDSPDWQAGSADGGVSVAGGHELRRLTSVAGKPGNLKAIAQSVHELRAEWPRLPCH